MSIPVQPFLHDGVIALRAPTQVWSRFDGDLGAAAIDGVYHGDTRFVRRVSLRVEGTGIEPIAADVAGASLAVFTSLLRGIDDASADPRVRLTRERTVEDGIVTERMRVDSHIETPILATVELELEPDFATMHVVKAGYDQAVAWQARTGARTTVVAGEHGRIEIDTDAATVTADAGVVRLAWALELAGFGTWTATWSLRLIAGGMVVRGAQTPRRLRVAASADPRANRWAERALADLDALRLASPEHPDDEFYAAGAPWFFTLFGRDSIWAARLSLRADPRMAASTLRVLARLQGTRNDPAAAEEPGKILHELRSATFEVPGEAISLPPVYYGSVDATPLWACLFADAVEAGLPEPETRELLPALRGVLGWLTAAGDGFLSYVDASGHGLSNQGWKDSGDSIQWRDGRLAEGPIALCEVQAYAYEAATRGAAVLDRLGEPGGDALREWAAGLRTRFRAAFWVDSPEGRYPAVALDRHGAAVDTLTSNIGHLLATGLLDHDEEAEIVRLLTGPTMLSGFGIRTLSTSAAGYWPLSYHCGSVWTHDTAIIAHGMLRAGFAAEARLVVDGMLRAAEGFSFRMPELHAGDSSDTTPVPIPYPAACRPQAWAAAAAITAVEVLAGP